MHMKSGIVWLTIVVAEEVAEESGVRADKVLSAPGRNLMKNQYSSSCHNTAVWVLSEGKRCTFRKKVAEILISPAAAQKNRRQRLRGHQRFRMAKTEIQNRNCCEPKAKV